MNIDFALVLFVLLVVTGGIWLLDKYLLVAQRDKDAAEPWWVEYAKSFFPVILIVFLIRSFIVEPFKIPSGSMIPTLKVGDFILVNKFTYGVRLPLVNLKLIELNQPERGDVMVFRYPENPSINYIKRVVALPGDTVEYKGKQLWVNGKQQAHSFVADYNYEKQLSFVNAKQYTETLSSGRNYQILIQPEDPTLALRGVNQGFAFFENCSYDFESVKCTVPQGHYYMLGDNRDDSRDSRYWGFVPDSYIVGKAFFVWMNFSDLGRIGESIE